MDLSKINEEIARDEQGLVVVIYGKDEEPYLAADGSEATITVLGADSKQVRAVRDRQTRRYLKNSGQKRTPEDLRRNRIEAAAAAVTAWHGWESDGQPMPCAPDNVRLLLRADHILVQVEEAIARPRNFTESSSES